jgi:precorrin-2 dehydrogenase/sirohydrochlorin ferrochelatase
MAANPGFPLVLDVKGWPVAVIGGDEEAAEKSQRLLDSGARVTVISPTLNEPLRRLAASGKIIHRGRFFRDADLEHTILILNTIRGDRDFAQMLLAQAREKGVLLWSVDMSWIRNSLSSWNGSDNCVNKPKPMNQMPRNAAHSSMRL